MVFTEVQFSTDIALGASGGPRFFTDIVVMKNGAEQRNINWSEPLGRYNVATGIKTKDDLEEITSFFYAHKGRAVGFRYKDWSDFEAAGEILGVGDGSQVVFHLQKTYTSGISQTVRAISKPVTGTCNIFVDAVLLSSGYTLDTTTGSVTFGTAPALDEVISADFEFDVPVRFDTDHIEARFTSPTSFQLDDLPLVEVRL